MSSKLKIILSEKRSWIYNLQYIFVSLILLIIVTLIDFKIININLPSILLTSVSLSKTVLGALTTGLLSIAIFGFSSVLAVITFYSNAFSPRIVEDFVGDKLTMKVIGIFIGGFVYCAMSLNFMRNFDENRLVLAGTIGVLYALFCVVYFVLFIQQTSKYVQINNLLNRLFDEGITVIEKESNARDYDSIEESMFDKEKLSIKSNKSGYFEDFDYKKVEEKLYEFQGIFQITKKEGDFLVEGEEIGILIDDNPDDYSDLVEDLQDAFMIYENKVSIVDYKYSLEKFVEIALKALSPGINDPMTAIYCIKKISLLLGKLARYNAYHHLTELENGGYIYYIANTFEEDLYDTLYPILNCSTDSPMMILGIFQGLKIISASSTRKNKNALINFLDDIYNNTKDKIIFSKDSKKVTDEYEKLKNFLEE